MRIIFLIAIILYSQLLYSQRPLNISAISKGVYTVPNTSFQPDVGLGYKNGHAGDGIASCDEGTGSRLVASVNLPHGVKVDSIKIYFRDYADAADLFISLLYYENAGGAMNELFTNSSDGKASAVRNQKVQLANLVIDNEKYSYYLLVQPKTGGWQPAKSIIGIRSVVFFFH